MSHNGRQSRMSESGISGAVILEEPEISGGTSGVRAESQNQDRPPFRCPFWPRQQTWLCVVPLLIGFIGLGLSLMLLKWIVVGTVRDYVPTDLVDANRIGQDPIFLSKPSGIPKSIDTTTTTTTTTTTVSPATTTTPEARTAGRGRTRLSTTTVVIHRGGGAYGNQVTPRNPGHRNGRHGFTTTTGAPRSTYTVGPGTSSPSPHNPTVLHDQTAMWTPEQTTTVITPTLTTQGHGHHKTPSPSVPPLHSEHFKPCHEKDLAYCLNGGECFVIETLSGPHKHCKCREGYQGIRCDQFLPKTDSILSDPHHLGIEFMESKDVYKRQVLSITSITMAISLLGIICMALYYRNKQHREKLQAHLKENRSLKNYNSHNALREQSRIPNNNLQMPQFCKKQSQHSAAHSSRSNISGSACDSPCNTSCIGNGTSKQLKRSFLFQSSSQKARTAHWSTICTSPSISKRRLSQIGGSSAYQHLHEVDSSKKDTEAKQRSQTKREYQHSSLREDALLHIQPSVPVETTLALYPRSNKNNTSFQKPMEHHHTAPPYLSTSIPIIPSVHCQYDKEVSCMQTKSFTSNINNITAKSLLKPCAPMIAQQQVEATLLLEEAQEHLRALAHCKHGDNADISDLRETLCFFTPNAGPSRAPNPPANIQILSKSNRKLATSNQ